MSSAGGRSVRRRSSPPPQAGGLFLALTAARPAHRGPCTDPFVHPEEPTAAEAIEADRRPISTCSTTGWTATASSSSSAASCRRSRRSGRTTRIACRAARARSGWRPRCATAGCILAGASDAAIVSGLVALLLRVYSGRPPAEILATRPEFLKDLGLLANLSSNRGSGIASMAAPHPRRRAGDVLQPLDSAGPPAAGLTRGQPGVGLFLAAFFAAGAVLDRLSCRSGSPTAASTPAAIGRSWASPRCSASSAVPGWGWVADRVGRQRTDAVRGRRVGRGSARAALPARRALPC